MSIHVITMSNGVRIGNLCSGHTFKFTDGSVLPACNEDRVNESKLIPREYLTPRDAHHRDCADVQWWDSTLGFDLSAPLIAMLNNAHSDWHNNYYPDVILVSKMVIDAMKKHRFDGWDPNNKFDHPFRTIRRDGREGDGKGNGLIHIDKFCV